MTEIILKGGPHDGLKLREKVMGIRFERWTEPLPRCVTGIYGRAIAIYEWTALQKQGPAITAIGTFSHLENRRGQRLRSDGSLMPKKKSRARKRNSA